jgi:hypothetical protein
MRYHVIGRSHTPTQRNTRPSQRPFAQRKKISLLSSRAMCVVALLGGERFVSGGRSKRFSRAKTGELAKKDFKAKRNGEQSEAKATERSEESARASEPRCEQSDERSESCECVSAPRSTTCCASCGKVCASGVVEHTTDDGDTREAAGKLLCATTLSSFDAAIVTRRRRRMTSFAFPSGGAPMGASLHLRRPLRRRRPGTEYADCTYGSDCADCGRARLGHHLRRRRG